ncbi:hypothetical protein U5B43_02875 [Campylobacter sp. 9BO]|uniref:hypothetical protein n=1 Tax=Campylobacter sp. 9BO TaxID=3424759 RepID=UPI003D350778
MRNVIFESSGLLKLFNPYCILLKQIQVSQGINVLQINKHGEYYEFDSVKFYLLDGEGDISFKECLDLPRTQDIKPYFSKLHDRGEAMLPDPNFEHDADRFMMRKSEPFFDEQTKKAVICFLKTMDLYTKNNKKIADIKECFILNKFYADKVRMHYKKRMENKNER